MRENTASYAENYDEWSKNIFSGPFNSFPAGFTKLSSGKRNKSCRRQGFMPDFGLTAKWFRLLRHSEFLIFAEKIAAFEVNRGLKRRRPITLQVLVNSYQSGGSIPRNARAAPQGNLTAAFFIPVFLEYSTSGPDMQSTETEKRRKLLRKKEVFDSKSNICGSVQGTSKNRLELKNSELRFGAVILQVPGYRR